MMFVSHSGYLSFFFTPFIPLQRHGICLLTIRSFFFLPIRMVKSLGIGADRRAAVTLFTKVTDLSVREIAAHVGVR